MKRYSLSVRQKLVRWNIVLAFVIASTALLPQPAQAAENHCIHPNGTDLNALYGISAQLVNPFCSQVDSGEHWTAAGPAWLMSPSFDAVPEGFVPAGATPLEDFLAKFVGVKYVLDPGTLQERTYFYPTSNKVWTGVIDGLPSVWPGTISIANPLSIGEHVVEAYWIFNAMHCDGLADVIEENCIGPGEVALVSPRVFQVTPSAVQSH